MHKNSYESRKNLISSGKQKKREDEIFQLLYFGDKQMTIKEMLSILYPGSDNKGLLAPRCTDMTVSEKNPYGALKVVSERLEGGNPVSVYGINWPVKPEPQEVMQF